MSTRCAVIFFLFFFTFNVNAQTTWNGSVDDDWHKACNWSTNTIPTATDDVVIPVVTTYPVISGNAHCLTLTITSPAANAVTLQSSTGAELCISSTNAGPCVTPLTDNGGCVLHTTSAAPICENQTKALTSTVAGTFSILSGSGSISGTTYTPANIAVDESITIRFDDGGGNIEDVTFTVNVNNVANNTTNTASICETETKTLVGSPGGGTWSIVSGGGSIAGTTYTPPNVGANTNVTVRYTIPANGACPATTSDRTFTVTPSPGIASNTTSTASICEGGSTKALVGSPGGGTWSIVSGPGSISGTTYTSPSVGASTNVTVRYTIAASGACAATTSDRTFTVIDNTPANNTTSTAAICEISTKSLTATPSGGTWSVVSGGGSISGTTYTPPNVAVTTPVTVRYSIPAAGSCPASSSDRTFNVDPSSGVASNTTSTAAICEDQTKSLVGSPGGGTWSIVSGGGSITGTTYTPANVASNTPVTIRYTIAASGTCPATTSDRTFTVNVRNIASNTTNTAAICENQTKALVGSPGGGTWSVVSGGGSISGTTYTPPNVASNTSVTVRYTIPANGACASSFSDRTFTVNSSPGVASNTTSTASICEGSTKALSGSPGGGTWSVVSGGGSISGTTYTSPSVGSSTNVTVRYTIAGSGACAASTSDRTFTVIDNTPANNTTSTASICETSTKLLTATPSGGTWSVVSGGGSISGTTYTPPNVGVNTVVTVRYSIPAAGSCPATTSDRSFTVNPSPGVANNTTSTASICETNTKALTGTPGGGTWSIVSGGGSISGSTYTPANVASNTSVTIRYTIPASGACPATTSNRTFTVNPSLGTASNTTSTASICETSTKALSGTPGGGTWSIVSGGGSISGTTYTPPNVASNTNVTVRYTIPANGACPSSNSNRTFTVNSSPGVASNTTSTASICEGSTKTLTGSPGGGSWSIVSGGGSISGNTYTAPSVGSNTTVTVRYTMPANGACASTFSNRSFTVTNQLVANNTTSTASICEGSTKTLTGSPGGGSWSIVSGGGSISGNTYTAPSVGSNTTVTVRYTIPASGGCPASISNRSFTVTNLVAASNTTSTASICEGSTKTLTGTPGGGTWSIVSGGGSISGNTYTAPSVGSNTTVTIRYTRPASGGCPATTSDRSFTVTNQLVANNTTSTAAIDDTETKALTGTPGGGSWSIISGGGSISGTTYTPADVSATTTVRIRYTRPASGGCPATTDDVVFDVNDASIPGAWFEPCNPGTPTGPFSFCSYDYFVCPGPGTTHVFYNNTSATITVTLPTQAGYVYLPSNPFTLPPGTSQGVSNSGGTPCNGFAQFGVATWTGSDGSSGSFNVVH